MARAAYAGYPTAKVYKEPSGKSERIGHLLWGTWVEHQEEESGDWAKVRIRGWDVNREKKIGWMRKKDLQENRVLEVYFIDVAQGDGCLLITPDDKFHLIDAGEGKNMAAYLHWKFNLGGGSPNPVVFENTIISHPDKDHYNGFFDIVKEPKVKFRNVYHNGLVERVGDDPLGPLDGDFLTDVIVDDAGLDGIIGDPALIKGKLYPKLMKQLRENGASVKMLCCEDQYLPGYGEDGDVTIRVLAPVPGSDADGKRTMRWFGPKSKAGETKNGHSVVVKIEYGGVRILCGGDLNVPAENHLLEHYTGVDPETADPGQMETLVAEARKIFEADVAKACHHGSADFTNLFLRSVNAAATIISSGDEEPHSHPRPDAVGALGKFGRGHRPLIFSTELARSTRDLIIKENPTEKELGRTVAVYGNIDVRTDGERVVIAQRFEQTPAHGEWDYYELVKDDDGVLSYASKHD
ncbi:MAG TPA: MBL fold metallo-hydrolase [Pyrinomonadaceae bacterium]|jgi:beta-lactamase superfamily II metal-dependent hydrolase